MPLDAKIVNVYLAHDVPIVCTLVACLFVLLLLNLNSVDITLLAFDLAYYARTPNILFHAKARIAMLTLKSL